METPLTQNIRPGVEPPDIAAYERAGGYQGLRTALTLAPAAIRELVVQSNLRGRGGAGFPTGRKWGFMPTGDAARRPKYLCVNADEMEPGTMKDRLLMEGDPHQLVEGALVSALAIEADVVYIFLRWEYHLSARRLKRAIAEAYAKGHLGKNILGSGRSVEMVLHSSAGRYMCGEEMGLLNALEGRRATPRTKPPHPVICGLWGKPTIVNNVETLCNVHHIVNRGPDWFRALAKSEDGGTKLYGVSGPVATPGVWELPMGATAREVIFGRGGGMRPGRAFRAAISGGASTGYILPEHLDAPMDFATMQQATGARLGTGTMIVLDDRTCPVGMLLSLATFFARESCGWCTPCREGLPWVVRSLAALEAGRGEPSDIEVLDRHVQLLRPGLTFCALAPGAMEPLESGLKHFRKDFVRHVTEKRCPWKEND